MSTWPIVRAGHQHVLGGILGYVLDIVGCCNMKHKDGRSRKNCPAACAPSARVADVFEDPRNPLRRGFDEAETELGKHFGQLAGDDGVARARGVRRHAPKPAPIADALAGSAPIGCPDWRCRYACQPEIDALLIAS